MKSASGFDLLDAFRHLHTAGGALTVQASLHGQLAVIEWEEEKQRLLKMLLALLLAFACLLCGLLLVGGFLLAAAWDTPYRITAAAGLALLAVVGVAGSWRSFQRGSARSPQAFAASREELATDAILLKASL